MPYNIAIRLFIIVFILCHPLLTFAQHTATGYIIDKESNAPLAGCSVFFTNTSLGTVTNKDGYFEIKNIPSGSYELIASSIGYENASYSFNTEKIPAQIKFLLQQKATVLETVVVGGYLTETWEKWGKTFLEYFIGTGENSAHTVLKNYDVLRFRYYKKLSKLEVVALAPLIIDNKSLGYKITYHLENFEINFSEKSNFYSGNVLFSDLNKKGPSRHALKKRQHAYEGSVMHFFRSVYNRDVNGQDFEVRRMKRLRNTEKDRVRKVLNIPLARKLLAVPEVSGDSGAYYKRVLAQDDYIDEYGPADIVADSIIIQSDRDFKIIAWKDYLVVQHKKKMEEQAYLDFHNERRKPFQIRSLIHMNGNEMLIDNNGNWAPANAMISEWYWAWGEKISNMLPLNYEP